MTWRRYLLESRLLRSMALLAEPGRTVLDIATTVGFGSLSAFTRAFNSYTGDTPTGYRRRVTAPAFRPSPGTGFFPLCGPGQWAMSRVASSLELPAVVLDHRPRDEPHDEGDGKLVGRMLADEIGETASPERLPACAAGLDDPIGVQQEAVARLQAGGHRLDIARAETPGKGRQALKRADDTPMAHEHRRRMAGGNPGECPGVQVQATDLPGDERTIAGTETAASRFRWMCSRIRPSRRSCR